jgi:magnesium-transporting ATPase (P-type)
MQEQTAKYRTFAAMIGTSTVVMLALMYFNSYSLDHVFWSETRFYMALYMGAAMAIVMLSFMLNMYGNSVRNISIYAGSAVLFVLALYLVRSQVTVQDESWMKAMIPHHSIAILTSDRAEIDDVRVRELADEIIQAQRREIKEMQWLIDDIRRNGVAATSEAAKNRPVPPFEGKLNP